MTEPIDVSTIISCALSRTGQCVGYMLHALQISHQQQQTVSAFLVFRNKQLELFERVDFRLD